MKKRVLIADNSEEFCDQLVYALKKHDMLEVVGIADDGEQTVRMMKQLKPDIVVFDLLLSKQGGINLLKEIYSMDNKPVVVATSGFVTDYVTIGADYLMLKPCDIGSLAELIESCREDNEAQKTSQKTTVSKIETPARDVFRNICAF